LRWADVDVANGSIHVRQRADFYGALGEPKSAAGHRSVPASPFVLNTLKEWKLACPKGRSRSGVSVKRRIGSRSCQHREAPLQTAVRAKIKLRWHDIRHFAVSLWIEQGFSIKEVMTFAGHASVQMTMERYGHLFLTLDHLRSMAEVEHRIFG
jgi:integrase